MLRVEFDLFLCSARFPTAAVATFEAKVAVLATVASGAAQEPPRDCGHGQSPAVLPPLAAEINSAPFIVFVKDNLEKLARCFSVRGRCLQTDQVVNCPMTGVRLYVIL